MRQRLSFFFFRHSLRFFFRHRLRFLSGGRDGNEKIARGQHLEVQRQDLIYIDSDSNHHPNLDEGNNEFDVKKQFDTSAPPGMERVLSFKISDLERTEITESENGRVSNDVFLIISLS